MDTTEAAFFLAYRTALEGWRFSTGLHPVAAKAPALLPHAPAPTIARLDANGLSARGTFSLPLHLLVGSDADRRASDVVRCHVCRTPLPPTAFAAWAPDVFISSPAFCFLQMAECLSTPRLILLGCELCGPYRPSPDPSGTLETRAPLTSIAEISSFVRLMPAPWHTQKAIGALTHVVEGVASPFEAAVAILLCLPYRDGGYALPKPQVNYRIEVSGLARGLTDRRYFLADFCWPEQQLVLEYDSNAHHTGAQHIASDSARRNALESVGYRVVTLTTRQLFDVVEFDRVAIQLSRYLGVRQRRRLTGESFEDRRQALRTDVLGAIARRRAQEQ